jgi:hypothetical protein
MSNEEMFVYGFWTFAGLIAVGVIGGAFIFGIRDGNPSSITFWRFIKLASSVLSIVGLVLLLVSFEQTVRDSMRAGSKEWVQDRFLEVKFIIERERAVACARQDTSSQDACKLLDNINNGIVIDYIRSGRGISLVTDRQLGNKLPISWQKDLNRVIEQMNGSITLAASKPTFSIETRIRIAMLAVIVLILSLAGSVGEAAYQYRQAKTTTRPRSKRK